MDFPAEQKYRDRNPMHQIPAGRVVYEPLQIEDRDPDCVEAALVITADAVELTRGGTIDMHVVAEQESAHINREILNSNFDGRQIHRECQRAATLSSANADIASQNINRSIAMSPNIDQLSDLTIRSIPTVSPEFGSSSTSVDSVDFSMDRGRYGQSGYQIGEYRSMYDETPGGSYQVGEYKSMYDVWSDGHSL